MHNTPKQGKMDEQIDNILKLKQETGAMYG